MAGPAVGCPATAPGIPRLHCMLAERLAGRGALPSTVPVVALITGTDWQSVITVWAAADCPALGRVGLTCFCRCRL